MCDFGKGRTPVCESKNRKRNPKIHAKREKIMKNYAKKTFLGIFKGKKAFGNKKKVVFSRCNNRNSINQIKNIQLQLMKKTLLFTLGLCAVFCLSSCKSQESAYKRAYEKAQAQESAQAGTTTVAIDEDEDISVTPVTSTTPASDAYSAEVENTPVRTINGGMEVVSGSSLRNYSVIVGSFVSQSNAETLASQLNAKGYDARIIKTNETINGHTGWYRVAASSYDSKASAVQSRNELIGKYAGAWLLYNK